MTQQGGAFEQAWYPGELPHHLKSTRVSQGPTGQLLTGNFRDRDLDKHNAMLGDVSGMLPDSGRLLVIGGGATRLFERQLAGERPDAAIVTVDPLLLYGPRERLRVAIQESMDSWENDDDSVTLYFPAEIERGQPYYARHAVAGMVGATACHKNHLPFATSAFDAVVGLYSIPTYAASEDSQTFALNEIARVMKPDAKGSFFPLLQTGVDMMQRDTLFMGLVRNVLATKVPREPMFYRRVSFIRNNVSWS